MIKRILYLGYYINEMEWNKFSSFLDFTVKKTSKSKARILFDVLCCVFKYNISILEYFHFFFFEKNAEERAKWAGTGFMYETIQILNPKANRTVLCDKKVFLEHYKQFVSHWHFTIADLEKDKRLLSKTVPPDVKKIIIKSSDGQCGRGIEVIDYNEISIDQLIKKMHSTKNDIIEEFVEQHDDLKQMSPSGLNTLRIITTLNANDEVEILGIRQRLAINSHIDNLAAGNIACEVDQTTGKIIGPGVYSDITKADVFQHPVTGKVIIGFQVPFFKESLALVKNAALYDKSNRSIGWDVAITNNGPELIEGNHDWCKLLWQLPVKKGLRNELEKFIR